MVLAADPIAEVAGPLPDEAFCDPVAWLDGAEPPAAVPDEGCPAAAEPPEDCPAEGARLGFGEALGAGGATTRVLSDDLPEFPELPEPAEFPGLAEGSAFFPFFDESAVKRVEPLDVRMILPEPGCLLSLTLPHPRCRSEALRPHPPVPQLLRQVLRPRSRVHALLR